MLQGIRAILDSSADSGIVVRFPGLSFAVTRGGQTFLLSGRDFRRLEIPELLQREYKRIEIILFSAVNLC